MASVPIDRSSMMYADLKEVKEKMTFIQAESMSIDIVHEQPISRVPPPSIFHDSFSQKRTVTCRSPELPKTRGSRDPFRSFEIFKRKQCSLALSKYS